jgi:hypothetical protein
VDKLQVRWGNGAMVTHVHEFMGFHNITKFKKLISTIKVSFNPDETMNTLKGCISKEIEQFEPESREYAKKHEAAIEKLQQHQQQIENLTSNREHFEKNTHGWQHYNELLKVERKELISQKACATRYKNLITKGKRNKEFCEKCLELISQGR